MSDEPAVGAKVAAQVASILERAKIPNVLFGWTPISLIGQGTKSPEIEFVVPDSMVKSATDALAAERRQCTNRDCAELSSMRLKKLSAGEERAENRSNPLHSVHVVPDAHFHLANYTVVSLLRKSRVLWWLPDFKLRPAANDTDFVLSTDEASLPPQHKDGPTGPWKQLHPIQILSPRTFTEALIVLFARDYRNPALLGFCVWRTMLDRVRDACERPGKLGYKRVLSAKFQLAWDYMNGRGPESQHPYLPFISLRAEMIENGAFSATDLPEVDITTFRGAEEFLAQSTPKTRWEGSFTSECG